MTLTYSLNELNSTAKQILANSTSKIFCFNAEMGTGKTTLIKALLEVLGSTDDVSSPTFSLVNEYKTNEETIYHFDLYRIEEEEELYDFGFETYINQNAYVFIEWPELALPIIGSDYTAINIELDSDFNRVLTLTNP